MGGVCRGHGRGTKKECAVLPTGRVSGRFRRRGDMCTKFKDKCGHPSTMCVQEEDALATLLALPGEPCDNSEALSEDLGMSLVQS